MCADKEEAEGLHGAHTTVVGTQDVHSHRRPLGTAGSEGSRQTLRFGVPVQHEVMGSRGCGC